MILARILRSQFGLSAAFGLFAFFVLVIQLQISVWEWDEFHYLFNIHEGQGSTILMGRPGFVIFFSGLWKLAQTFGVQDFHGVFVSCIPVFNCAFIGLTLGALLWIVQPFFIDRTMPLLVVSLALGNRVVLDSVLGIFPDAMMTAAVVVSYAFFIHALKVRSTKTLMLSALIFALAIHVREAAIIFVPFFPGYFLSVRTQHGAAAKDLVVHLSVVVFATILPILWLNYLSDGQTLRNFLHSEAHSNRYDLSLFLYGIKVAVVRHFANPVYLGAPLVFGAWLMYRQSPKLGISRNAGYGIILYSALPCVLTILIANAEVPKWDRYFLAGAAAWSLCLAAVVYFPVRGRRWARPSLVVMVLAILAAHNWDFVKRRNQIHHKSGEFEAVYQRYSPHFDSQVAWIVGRNSSYAQYRMAADGHVAQVITSGWAWPGKKIKETIESHHHAGRAVIYDPQAPWDVFEKEDLRDLPQWFNLESKPNGLIYIRPI